MGANKVEHYAIPAIPLLDIEYLRQVYRDKHGSKPH